MVRAPASTANLGPGFDCAGAALELWNELYVEEGTGIEIDGEGADELPRDEQHLALRAFALFAPPEGRRFRFVNRIPLERGLGSSAAAIALGLVAGAAVAGEPVTPDDLLQAGEPLEGHADNLAAALHGGVCFAWRRDGRIVAKRIADELPAVPIVAVPAVRTYTKGSRAALPEHVSHADASANSARAALLGVALATGDAVLLRDAFNDFLHEPYRRTELLDRLRDNPPAGTIGVTLSGSGPSVVVWAEREHADSVAAELVRTLPENTKVLPLRVAQTGAGLT